MKQSTLQQMLTLEEGAVNFKNLATALIPSALGLEIYRQFDLMGQGFATGPDALKVVFRDKEPDNSLKSKLKRYLIKTTYKGMGFVSGTMAELITYGLPTLLTIDEISKDGNYVLSAACVGLFGLVRTMPYIWFKSLNRYARGVVNQMHKIIRDKRELRDLVTERVESE